MARSWTYLVVETPRGGALLDLFGCRDTARWRAPGLIWLSRHREVARSWTYLVVETPRGGALLDLFGCRDTARWRAPGLIWLSRHREVARSWTYLVVETPRGGALLDLFGCRDTARWRAPGLIWLSRHREVARSWTYSSDEYISDIQTRDIATNTASCLPVIPICFPRPALSSLYPLNTTSKWVLVISAF